MDLLTLEGNIGMPSPEASRIAAFQKIIDRDDDPRKEQASKELAYVYYMVDWDSNYQGYEAQERSKRLAVDLFEDPDWEPDELVQQAVDKYRDIRKNEYTMMLDDAREGVRSMREFFREVDLTKTDHDGKAVYKPSDLRSALKDMASIMENLDKLKELVKKHETKQQKTRGDIKPNKYTEG